MALDPTTFAILRSSFINIANEMALTLGKVAYFPGHHRGTRFRRGDLRRQRPSGGCRRA